MMTIRIRILIAISLLSIALSSFILRVRTMDGQIYRFDVDEEIKTIKQCRNKLIEIGKISESSILKIKDNEFNESSEESLDSLSLTNGEIVTVVDMQPQKQTSNQSTSNKTTGEVTIDKSVSKKKLPATTSTSVSMKKKVVSIASMTAQKQSLEKIIRQKSSTIAQSVIVMPSTERIFNRIATGGVALLLGRTLQYKPTFKTKKSSVPSTTTASTSSTSDRSIERNLTVIYAAYELICSADENNNSDAISSKITDYDSVTFAAAIERQKDRISEVRAIAASMGLQIVGCCIGHPSIETSGSGDSSGSSGKKRVKKSLKSGKNNEDDTDGERWNADHIHSCVQLREQLGSHLSAIDQELFVTLSVGKYTEPKANAADKNKGKLSRPLNSIRNGLSIEAYRLSDQANRLIQQGGVTVIPGTLVADGSDTISKRKPSSLTRRATSSGSSSTESIAQRRQLHLHKQVLFKNRETTVVEPLLLALPLPILQKLPSSATPRSTTTATTASATAPSNFNFLHLFPTESELRHSVTTATLSRKLILQLVLKMEKGLSSELKDKLRDIHLLKYLNEYFDHSSVCSIAQCVVSDSSTKLPSSVLMAIQMTKPILQDSGIDSDESEL